MKNITSMNAYELDFYEAGILDADEGVSVIPCKSKRYMGLIEKHRSTIHDERGNDMDSYLLGVRFETNRQLRLAGII